MSNRANYLKIGLFVITGTVIALTAVIVLGVGAVFRPEIMVESYFEDSVQGLGVGSPVTFRGVQIGKVDKIGLVSQEYATGRRYVLVRMELFTDVFLVQTEADEGEGLEELIRQGLRVRLNFQGVTGTAFIEADYLEAERYPRLDFDWQPDYPYIPSAPSIMTRLTDSLDQIMQSLEQINIAGLTSSLQQSLDTISQIAEDANVAGIGREAEQLLQEMRVTNREIEGLVREIEVEPLISETSATLRDTRRLIEEIRPPLREFLQKATRTTAKIDRMAGRIEESGNLAATLDRIQRSSRRLDNLLADQEPEIELIIRNFRILSENFRTVSEELAQNPRNFIFGGPPPQTLIGGE